MVQVIKSYFESEQSNVDNHQSPIHFLNIINPVLCRLVALVNAILNWIQRDIGRYFSNWDMPNLVAVWKSDLKIILQDVKECLNDGESLCSSIGNYEYKNWFTERCTLLLCIARDCITALQVYLLIEDI